MRTWQRKYNLFKDLKISGLSGFSFWAIEPIWKDGNDRKLPICLNSELIYISLSFKTGNFVFYWKKASLLWSNVTFRRFWHFRRIDLAGIGISSSISVQTWRVIKICISMLSLLMLYSSLITLKFDVILKRWELSFSFFGAVYFVWSVSNIESSFSLYRLRLLYRKETSKGLKIIFWGC